MKKIIKVAFAVVFAAIAGYGVYTNQKSDMASDLMLANVEALADGESGSYSGCYSGSGYCAIYVGSNCIFSSYSHYPR